MNTADEVKAHANDMELASVDFLKKDGSYCRGDIRKLDRVRLTFIDGKTFVMPKDEWTALVRPLWVSHWHAAEQPTDMPDARPWQDRDGEWYWRRDLTG